MKVIVNDLDSFLDKLTKVAQQTNKLQERVADIIAQKGVEIAKQQGIGTVYTIGSKGNRKVIIEGVGLRYQEYGTGQRGQGTYEGTLPTEPISFVSKFNGKSRPVTVPTWIYDYKQTVFSDENPKPHGGFSANMPMYKTSVELQEFIKTKLRGELKK